MAGIFIYALLLAAIGLLVPNSWWDPRSGAFLLAFGVIAGWRYAWGATHFIRSIIYRQLVFPRLRAKADAMGIEGMPSHVYLLLTSFRIDTETSMAVYSAAIREAIDCGAPTTLVCSIVEMHDQRLIKALFDAAKPPPRVDLTFIRVQGTGKRDALAQGFRAISMMRPPDDSVSVVIDGDSVLEERALARTLPFFKLLPNMDALTTDERAEVMTGSQLFRDWYNMRFAQRQISMSSMALSKKVLTLTGRMSAFRTAAVMAPDFIKTIERDSVDHWRLGTFQFLTGDDKTSWYHILKSGRDMLYVPDVVVLTLETPPDRNFMRAAATLMIRWFGNMLRTNGRALTLGPGKVGPFIWWSILDQRVTMWTSLIGPTGAVLLLLSGFPAAIFLYLYWVSLTRLVQTLALRTVRQEISWRYPFLLYFNQFFGSVIKTYVFFRLDRQKWTRQKTSSSRDLDAMRTWLIRQSSWSMHALAVTGFIVAVAYAIGLILLRPGDLTLLFL
jgi:mannuronan synthase